MAKMVMHFPATLTEEEDLLLKKYAKLKKKKKALQALRTQKSEPAPVTSDPTKRSSEEAANATEQAKKLLKLGAIKVGVEKKEQTSFKRSKRQKDPEKPPVGFTPFAATQNEDEEREAEEEGKLVEPVSKETEKGSDSDPLDRSVEHDRSERDRSGDRERDRGGDRRGKARYGRGLYDSFVSSKSVADRPERRDRRESEHERDAPRKGHTVYVHGHGLTEEIVTKAFSGIGTIVNVSLEPEKNCAFVSFERTESADEAISQVHGSMVAGIQLRVSMARRQPTFEANPTDPSGSSWSSIAASHSQKGTHKDKRDMITYEQDIF